uniref:C-type lectin domain-containing protein n=1 Tax=Panagrolaimus superbus TaxID=310955 RepID=A0A914Y6Q8_9BILA
MQLVAFFSLLYFCINSVFALCPVGSVGWQNSCYSFQSNSTSFTNAEIVCENLNGHLTSIHNGFTDALIAGYQKSKHYKFQKSSIRQV